MGRVADRVVRRRARLITGTIGAARARHGQGDAAEFAFPAGASLEQVLVGRINAELASARATARLVTGLPVMLLVTGQSLGLEPWHFLLETYAGVGCLTVGLALTATGLRWIDAIGDSVRGAR